LNLRSRQDELLGMNRVYGQRPSPAGYFGQWFDSSASMQAWAPAHDISERKDAYLVTVELPGVKAAAAGAAVSDGARRRAGHGGHTTPGGVTPMARTRKTSPTAPAPVAAGDAVIPARLWLTAIAGAAVLLLAYHLVTGRSSGRFAHR
jgi:hypothetical protein